MSKRLNHLGFRSSYIRFSGEGFSRCLNRHCLATALTSKISITRPEFRKGSLLAPVFSSKSAAHVERQGGGKIDKAISTLVDRIVRYHARKISN